MPKITFHTSYKEEVVQRRLLELLPIDSSFWKGSEGSGLEGWTMLGSHNDWAMIKVKPGVYKLWSRKELPDDFQQTLEFLL